nr:MAG TPA: hypothetical protein [Caudoviricetes sp.]
MVWGVIHHKKAALHRDGAGLLLQLKWSHLWERKARNGTGAECIAAGRKKQGENYSSSLPETLLMT